MNRRSDLIGPADPWTQTIRETAIWCLPRCTQQSVEAALSEWESSGHPYDAPAPILRSAQLLPRELAEVGGELLMASAAKRSRLVNQLVQSRAAAVAQTRLTDIDHVRCGRLLGLSVEKSDASAACLTNTRGMFSLYDAPPWDLWLCHVVPPGARDHDGYLISWIPEPLVQIADSAVRVNPVNALWWR